MQIKIPQPQLDHGNRFDLHTIDGTNVLDETSREIKFVESNKR